MKASLIAIMSGIAAFALAAQKVPVAPAGMVYVPGGTYFMGSGDSEPDRFSVPVHPMTVAGFFIGTCEVTQREWIAVMGSNPSLFIGADLPVEHVTWYDAVDFCNKKSLIEGLRPAYLVDPTSTDPRNRNGLDDYQWLVRVDPGANGYRLPTEAEWEYAARGGPDSGSRVLAFSGSSNAGEVAWYEENSGDRTHTVGTKKPNTLGLFDMSGNVWEWCWDVYEGYTEEAQIDSPSVASGSTRVIRSGSYSWLCRVAVRRYECPCYPPNVGDYIGLRIVRH